MKRSLSRILRMHNSVEAATSAHCWGKKTKGYPGVAGKGGKTLNFEIKQKKEEE